MSTVGEYVGSTKFQGVGIPPGVAGQVSSFQGTPNDGSYELLSGIEGASGDQGDPGIPFRWQGDIADQVALNALAQSLKLVHAGYAFRVLSDNSLMFWNGTGFETFLEAFGGMGLNGRVNNLTIGTVNTVAAGQPFVVTVTGTVPNQVLNFSIPRGGQGEKGPDGGPGPLRDAPDYDDTVTHTQNMVPLWDVTLEKFVPTVYPGWRGPWHWTSASFAASQTNVSTSPNTILTMTIPPQDFRWRPFVTGGCIIRTAATDASARYDLDVRIGSTAGPTIARGGGFGFAINNFNHVVPHSTGVYVPGDTAETIAAGATATLVACIFLNLGSGNYSYSNSEANMTVWAQPVVAAP